MTLLDDVTRLLEAASHALAATNEETLTVSPTARQQCPLSVVRQPLAKLQAPVTVKVSTAAKSIVSAVLTRTMSTLLAC